MFLVCLVCGCVMGTVVIGLDIVRKRRLRQLRERQLLLQAIRNLT
jgi:Na+-transporting NADH:ubiquinone oxidoreductase subunit NqrC